MDIPFDLLYIVASFYTKPRMKLLDWILKNNPNWLKCKWNWKELSKNPNAIHLLEKNLDKINWYNLSFNPNAIHLLEKNPDKINWHSLSENPNAIHLLKNNPDKINWAFLSANPSIFEIDTNQTKIYTMKKAKNIDYI